MSNLFLDDLRLPGGEAGAIAIEAGRIAAVGPGVAAPQGARRISGQGRLAIPGAIDMHVHFRTPGGEHKETLLTGSRAAVKGGTTTVADMPNTNPPTTTVARLEEKIALARGAPANILFNFGVEPQSVDELRRAAEFPQVVAVKVYLGPSTGVGGLAPEAVVRVFRLAAELDLPVMAHAEDMAMIGADAGRFAHDARHHHRLRSLEAELSAVDQALAMARDCGIRLYLCHVTSARVLDRVEASGIRERVFVEVCPHHLIFSVDDIASPADNRYKVNPPLREEPERRALFAALAGRIDGLGSDHAPHTRQEKAAPYDDAPSGIPGVEHLLPLALDWWRRGEITLERMIALTSGNVARYFGLAKGALVPGNDADIVLVDPDREWSLGEGEDRIWSKCGWSPYAGRAMRGRPELTVVGGEVVHRVEDA